MWLEQCKCKVKYEDNAGEHKLFVIKGVGSSLMGCDWLQDIHLKLYETGQPTLNHVSPVIHNNPSL